MPLNLVDIDQGFVSEDLPNLETRWKRVKLRQKRVVSPICRIQAWLRERSIGWWLFKFSEGHIFLLRRSLGRSYIDTEASAETDPSQPPVAQFTAHSKVLRTAGGDVVGRLDG